MAQKNAIFLLVTFYHCRGVFNNHVTSWSTSNDAKLVSNSLSSQADAFSESRENNGVICHDTKYLQNVFLNLDSLLDGQHAQGSSMSIYERGSHWDGVITSAVQIHLNSLRLVKDTNFVTWVSDLVVMNGEWWFLNEIFLIFLH